MWGGRGSSYPAVVSTVQVPRGVGWSTAGAFHIHRVQTNNSIQKRNKLGLGWAWLQSKGRRKRRRLPRCACHCQPQWDRLGQLSTACASTGQSFCWMWCLTECNCGAKNWFFSLCWSLMFFLNCVRYLPNLFGSVCDISMGVIFYFQIHVNGLYSWWSLWFNTVEVHMHLARLECILVFYVTCKSPCTPFINKYMV